MITSTDAVFCLELKSIAMGYRLLQTITTFSSIRVLDASPCGDRFFVLAVGPTHEMEEMQAAARDALDSTERDSWLDAELIKECESAVLEAIYHLPQVEVKESLLIAECGSISGLLAVAQSLTHGHEISVIEIKIKRSGGGAYGFFTGSREICAPAAEEARTKLKRAMRTGHIEHVEEMTAKFKEHFNLSGASN